MGSRDPRCEVDGCRYIAAIGHARCVQHGGEPPTRVPDGDAPIDKMRKCGALRRDGGRCTQPPRKGAARCRLHGASTERALARADERLRQAGVTSDARHYGRPRTISAFDALEEELHRTQGHVDWLDEQLAQQGADPVWLAVYQAERAHLARLSQSMITSSVYERRAALNERTMRTLEVAINGIVADLGYDPHTARTRRIVERNLIAATSGTGTNLPPPVVTGDVVHPDPGMPQPLDF